MPEIAKYVHVNSFGTALMLEVIRERNLPIRKILVASSQAVYSEGAGKCPNHAIVQVPRVLPRLILMPRGRGEDEPWDYIYLSALIKHHIADLFPGLILDGVHAFRVTRNSDLYIDDEEAENLLRSIEVELRRSSRGDAVRLEVEADCPKDFRELLLEFFDLGELDLYRADGPLSMTHLMPLVTNDAFAKLRDRAFQPVRDPALPPHGTGVVECRELE